MSGFLRILAFLLLLRGGWPLSLVRFEWKRKHDDGGSCNSLKYASPIWFSNDVSSYFLASFNCRSELFIANMHKFSFLASTPDATPACVPYALARATDLAVAVLPSLDSSLPGLRPLIIASPSENLIMIVTTSSPQTCVTVPIDEASLGFNVRNLGASVAVLGDVNGDGCYDFAVSSLATQNPPLGVKLAGNLDTKHGSPSTGSLLIVFPTCKNKAYVAPFKYFLAMAGTFTLPTCVIPPTAPTPASGSTVYIPTTPAFTGWPSRPYLGVGGTVGTRDSDCRLSRPDAPHTWFVGLAGADVNGGRVFDANGDGIPDLLFAVQSGDSVTPPIITDVGIIMFAADGSIARMQLQTTSVADETVGLGRFINKMKFRVLSMSICHRVLPGHRLPLVVMTTTGVRPFIFSLSDLTTGVELTTSATYGAVQHSGYVDCSTGVGRLGEVSFSSAGLALAVGGKGQFSVWEAEPGSTVLLTASVTAAMFPTPAYPAIPLRWASPVRCFETTEKGPFGPWWSGPPVSVGLWGGKGSSTSTVYGSFIVPMIPNTLLNGFMGPPSPLGISPTVPIFQLTRMVPFTITASYKLAAPEVNFVTQPSSITSREGPYATLRVSTGPVGLGGAALLPTFPFNGRSLPGPALVFANSFGLLVVTPRDVSVQSPRKTWNAIGAHYQELLTGTEYPPYVNATYAKSGIPSDDFKPTGRCVVDITYCGPDDPNAVRSILVGRPGDTTASAGEVLLVHIKAQSTVVPSSGTPPTSVMAPSVAGWSIIPPPFGALKFGASICVLGPIGGLTWSASSRMYVMQPDITSTKYADAFVVGAPHQGAGGGMRGSVYIYEKLPTDAAYTQSLALTGGSVPTTNGKTIIWPGLGDLFGTSVGCSPGSDYDGDGWPDLLVGAPGANNGRGRIFRFLLEKSLLSFDARGLQLKTGAGAVTVLDDTVSLASVPVSDFALGTSVDILGDADADGNIEVAFGTARQKSPAGDPFTEPRVIVAELESSSYAYFDPSAAAVTLPLLNSVPCVDIDTAFASSSPMCLGQPQDPFGATSCWSRCVLLPASRYGLEPILLPPLVNLEVGTFVMDDPAALPSHRPLFMPPALASLASGRGRRLVAYRHTTWTDQASSFPWMDSCFDSAMVRWGIIPQIPSSAAGSPLEFTLQWEAGGGASLAVGSSNSDSSIPTANMFPRAGKGVTAEDGLIVSSATVPTAMFYSFICDMPNPGGWCAILRVCVKEFDTPTLTKTKTETMKVLTNTTTLTRTGPVETETLTLTRSGPVETKTLTLTRSDAVETKTVTPPDVHSKTQTNTAIVPTAPNAPAISKTRSRVSRPPLRSVTDTPILPSPSETPQAPARSPIEVSATPTIPTATPRRVVTLPDVDPDTSPQTQDVRDAIEAAAGRTSGVAAAAVLIASPSAALAGVMVSALADCVISAQFIAKRVEIEEDALPFGVSDRVEVLAVKDGGASAVHSVPVGGAPSPGHPGNATGNTTTGTNTTGTNVTGGNVTSTNATDSNVTSPNTNSTGTNTTGSNSSVTNTTNTTGTNTTGTNASHGPIHTAPSPSSPSPSVPSLPSSTPTPTVAPTLPCFLDRRSRAGGARFALHAPLLGLLSQRLGAWYGFQCVPDALYAVIDNVSCIILASAVLVLARFLLMPCLMRHVTRTPLRMQKLLLAVHGTLVFPRAEIQMLLMLAPLLLGSFMLLVCTAIIELIRQSGDGSLNTPSITMLVANASANANAMGAQAPAAPAAPTPPAPPTVPTVPTVPVVPSMPPTASPPVVMGTPSVPSPSVPLVPPDGNTNNSNNANNNNSANSNTGTGAGAGAGSGAGAAGGGASSGNTGAPGSGATGTTGTTTGGAGSGGVKSHRLASTSHHMVPSHHVTLAASHPLEVSLIFNVFDDDAIDPTAATASSVFDTASTASHGASPSIGVLHASLADASGALLHTRLADVLAMSPLPIPVPPVPSPSQLPPAPTPHSNDTPTTPAGGAGGGGGGPGAAPDVAGGAGATPSPPPQGPLSRVNTTLLWVCAIAGSVALLLGNLIMIVSVYLYRRAGKVCRVWEFGHVTLVVGGVGVENIHSPDGPNSKGDGSDDDDDDALGKKKSPTKATKGKRKHAKGTVEIDDGSDDKAKGGGTVLQQSLAAAKRVSVSLEDACNRWQRVEDYDAGALRRVYTPAGGYGPARYILDRKLQRLDPTMLTAHFDDKPSQGDVDTCPQAQTKAEAKVVDTKRQQQQAQLLGSSDEENGSSPDGPQKTPRGKGHRFLHKGKTGIGGGGGGGSGAAAAAATVCGGDHADDVTVISEQLKSFIPLRSWFSCETSLPSSLHTRTPSTPTSGGCAIEQDCTSRVVLGPPLRVVPPQGVPPGLLQYFTVPPTMPSGGDSPRIPSPSPSPSPHQNIRGKVVDDDGDGDGDDAHTNGTTRRRAVSFTGAIGDAGMDPKTPNPFPNRPACPPPPAVADAAAVLSPVMAHGYCGGRAADADFGVCRSYLPPRTLHHLELNSEDAAVAVAAANRERRNASHRPAIAPLRRGVLRRGSIGWRVWWAVIHAWCLALAALSPRNWAIMAGAVGHPRGYWDTDALPAPLLPFRPWLMHMMPSSWFLRGAELVCLSVMHQALGCTLLPCEYQWWVVVLSGLALVLRIARRGDFVRIGEWLSVFLVSSSNFFLGVYALLVLYVFGDLLRFMSEVLIGTSVMLNAGVGLKLWVVSARFIELIVLQLFALQSTRMLSRFHRRLQESGLVEASKLFAGGAVTTGPHSNGKPSRKFRSEGGFSAGILLRALRDAPFLRPGSQQVTSRGVPFRQPDEADTKDILRQPSMESVLQLRRPDQSSAKLTEQLYPKPSALHTVATILRRASIRRPEPHWEPVIEVVVEETPPSRSGAVPLVKLNTRQTVPTAIYGQPLSRDQYATEKELMEGMRPPPAEGSGRGKSRRHRDGGTRKRHRSNPKGNDKDRDRSHH